MNLAVGWLLVSALLVLRVQADVLAEELTENQKKVVQLVMEKFHQNNWRNAFRMTSIVNAKELDNSGIFVNVEFLLKRTSCNKQDWRKPDCEVIKGARTFNCFGCFKFESNSHSVISQYEQCILPEQVEWDQRNDQCKKVENAEKMLSGVYTLMGRRGKELESRR